MVIDDNVDKGSEATKSYREPINSRFDLIPQLAIRRLANIFEEGAQKYGENAYIEKPIPYSVIMNHVFNHLNLFIIGDRTEDHLAKVMWGMCAIMVLEELEPNSAMSDLRAYGIA